MIKTNLPVTLSKPEDGRGENQRSGRLSSGASPGLIAGSSEFPRGKEVLHDLNERSWLPAFWQVAEASSNFRSLRKICFLFLCDAPSWVCLSYA